MTAIDAHAQRQGGRDLYGLCQVEGGKGAVAVLRDTPLAERADDLPALPGGDLETGAHRTRIDLFARCDLVEPDEADGARYRIARAEAMTGRQVDRLGIVERDAAADLQFERVAQQAPRNAAVEHGRPIGGRIEQAIGEMGKTEPAAGGFAIICDLAARRAPSKVLSEAFILPGTTDEVQLLGQAQTGIDADLAAT